MASGDDTDNHLRSNRIPQAAADGSRTRTMSGIAQFLGGLGLFLLGMWLMTDGLKLAAGPALERILRDWTSSRGRGLLSGVLVTALVQSSSAVTVATIGFANAGLLTLGQAMWVIFGTNVGTTMTGWLVALVGFRIDVTAFALPAIGIGMLLRLTAEGTRRGALGLAVAGFGTLFVGIDVLQQTFADAGTRIDLGALSRPGIAGVLLNVAIGIVLTTLMQSSSAAMAVVLTAAAGDVVGLPAAAATVIGVNVGTTVKALLAALAATPNARRTAAAHVAFNLITGIVALLLLVPLLALVAWMTEALDLDPTPAVVLAAFHTVFNLLGVALMWPLSGPLERVLQQWFRTAEEDEGRPRYLDANVLGVPALALNALALETNRIGDIGKRMLLAALRGGPAGSLARERALLDRLVPTVADFVIRIQRIDLSAVTGERLPRVLRLLRHYETIAVLAETIEQNRTPEHGLPGGLAPRLAAFRAAVAHHVETVLAEPAAGPALPEADAAADHHAARLHALLADYAELKESVFDAVAAGALSVDEMDRLLEQSRAARRAAEQASEAAEVIRRLSRPAQQSLAVGEDRQPGVDPDTPSARSTE
jgi:phosphate:Na+ symporter